MKYRYHKFLAANAIKKHKSRNLSGKKALQAMPDTRLGFWYLHALPLRMHRTFIYSIKYESLVSLLLISFNRDVWLSFQDSFAENNLRQ
jgi:hypothetical protein